MDIHDDHVTFTDGEQPRRELDWDKWNEEPSLARDLWHDTAFRAALSDFAFASAAYCSLQDRDFFKIEVGKWWSCGERRAAHLIANLGECGDSYQDFFPFNKVPGHPPDDRPYQLDLIDKRIRRLITGDIRLQGGTPTTQEWLDVRRFLETKVIDVSSEHLFYKYFTNCKNDWNGVFANGELYDRVHSHILRLGWRRKNSSELEEERLASMVAARAAARVSLGRRVEALHRIRRYEARPEDQTPEWAKPPRCTKFCGLDVEGLGPLSDVEREAIKGQLASRICALAETGRVTEAEFISLKDHLR